MASASTSGEHAKFRRVKPRPWVPKSGPGLSATRASSARTLGSSPQPSPLAIEPGQEGRVRRPEPDPGQFRSEQLGQQRLARLERDERAIQPVIAVGEGGDAGVQPQDARAPADLDRHPVEQRERPVRRGHHHRALRPRKVERLAGRGHRDAVLAGRIRHGQKRREPSPSSVSAARGSRHSRP